MGVNPRSSRNQTTKMRRNMTRRWSSRGYKGHPWIVDTRLPRHHVIGGICRLTLAQHREDIRPLRRRPVFKLVWTRVSLYNT